MPHRSRVIIPLPAPSPSPADLADALAELSRCDDRAALLEAACGAYGRLLGLGAVAAVRLAPTAVVCDGRWARHGARPNRVGEARVAAGLDLLQEGGDAVCQRTFGRLELIAVRMPSEDNQPRAF